MDTISRIPLSTQSPEPDWRALVVAPTPLFPSHRHLMALVRWVRTGRLEAVLVVALAAWLRPELCSMIASFLRDCPAPPRWLAAERPRPSRTSAAAGPRAPPPAGRAPVLPPDGSVTIAARVIRPLDSSPARITIRPLSGGPSIPVPSVRCLGDVAVWIRYHGGDSIPLADDELLVLFRAHDGLWSPFIAGATSAEARP